MFSFMKVNKERVIKGLLNDWPKTKEHGLHLVSHINLLSPILYLDCDFIILFLAYST